MTEWNDQNGEQPLALSAKRCPKCGKIVSLQTTQCERCAHQFRTRFQDPIDRTQAFDAVLLPRAPHPPHQPSQQPDHESNHRSAHRSSRRSAYRAVHRAPVPVRAYPAALVTFGLAFLGSFSLVALLGVGAWLALGLNQPVTPVLTKPAALASTSPRVRSGDARNLYDQVTLSMSLYDLDQAAGGLGRVIHSSDLHTLLLSYDYPEQSVRVSLYRVDTGTDDYRVQAVALYRGQQLLNRTSGD